MAVGIYLRVSTEEQRERQSIATQRDFAERYCSLHELDVHRYYADDGVSGTILLEERPEGRRILLDARQRKFDQLLVYKLDRLGRDTRLILNAVAELERLGVRIRSMTEEFDTATATGRLMLTMLSGFAAHEREVIRERSIAGTNRLAEAGAWLGGIVPYGYRKEGKRREARLVISEDPIAGLNLSEAEVIRSIYRMTSTEKKSCRRIADYLNQLGVPCAYIRDDRLLLRGKRKETTSGIWRPGRVRNLIVSATYMGLHQYGKRSKNANRVPISREVPAIVTREVWMDAQQVLKSNYVFGKRNAKNRYLLRGLMKCGLCNLTYIGLASCRPNGTRELYYRCNAKHGTRGIYGATGQRCPSKDLNGRYIEALIWSEVEGFLQNPGTVLNQLRERMALETEDSGRWKQRLDGLQQLLKKKGSERDRILALFRRGRITEVDLDKQLDQIQKEEDSLKAQMQEVTDRVRTADLGAMRLSSAEVLLDRLRSRLERSVSWEMKRQLIEKLVGSITIDTRETAGKKENVVRVEYRFAGSVETCTGMGSWRRPA